MPEAVWWLRIEMEPPDPATENAARHRRILLICVAVGVGLPLALFVVRHLGLF